VFCRAAKQDVEPIRKVNTMRIPRTNALSFVVNVAAARHPPVFTRARFRVRAIARRLLARPADDYDWATYHEFYGPENESEAKVFTYNLDDVEHRVIDGRLYTIADAKPIAFPHRAVFEAILGLPEVHSVHEVGAGGGKLIVNLGKLLGDSCALGASDIGQGQLRLFEGNWPKEHRHIKPFVHDVTVAPLPESARADVVYTATVLMHIQRKDSYENALANLLTSARKYLVLVENWDRHDYVTDMLAVAAREPSLGPIRLGLFDSGAATAMVVARGDATLGEAYGPLQRTQELCKY
jgi:hypothetical protein